MTCQHVSCWDCMGRQLADKEEACKACGPSPLAGCQTTSSSSCWKRTKRCCCPLSTCYPPTRFHPHPTCLAHALSITGPIEHLVISVGRGWWKEEKAVVVVSREHLLALLPCACHTSTAALLCVQSTSHSSQHRSQRSPSHNLSCEQWLLLRLHSQRHFSPLLRTRLHAIVTGPAASQPVTCCLLLTHHRLRQQWPVVACTRQRYCFSSAPGMPAFSLSAMHPSPQPAYLHPSMHHSHPPLHPSPPPYHPHQHPHARPLNITVTGHPPTSHSTPPTCSRQQQQQQQLHPSYRLSGSPPPLPLTDTSRQRMPQCTRRRTTARSHSSHGTASVATHIRSDIISSSGASRNEERQGRRSQQESNLRREHALQSRKRRKTSERAKPARERRKIETAATRKRRRGRRRRPRSPSTRSTSQSRLPPLPPPLPRPRPLTATVEPTTTA